MTAQEIASYWIEYNDSRITEYFFCGENHGGSYSPINDYQALHDYLRAWLEDVLSAVFAYPWVDEYKTIYQRYLTQWIEKK